VNREQENDTISNEKDETILWESHYATTLFINITTIRNIIGNESTMNYVFQDQPKYYLDMLRNPATINQKMIIHIIDLVMDINEGTLEVEA
jgi:hypothetical protein